MEYDGTARWANGNGFRGYGISDPIEPFATKIDRIIFFEFIYNLLAPYYPSIDRPSTDPVSMFKMLLVGYLYGIKSERRLEEVRLNLAYRCFCGFELDEAIPDYSAFSKTGTRKWQESLPAFRIGRCWKIPKEAVQEFLQLRKSVL